MHTTCPPHLVCSYIPTNPQSKKIVQEHARAKFAETIDIAINLGIDARRGDQNVRGAAVLPHGIGRTVKVAVFTEGDHAEVARQAGM